MQKPSSIDDIERSFEVIIECFGMKRDDDPHVRPLTSIPLQAREYAHISISKISEHCVKEINCATVKEIDQSRHLSLKYFCSAWKMRHNPRSVNLASYPRAPRKLRARAIWNPRKKKFQTVT